MSHRTRLFPGTFLIAWFLLPLMPAASASAQTKVSPQFSDSPPSQQNRTASEPFDEDEKAPQRVADDSARYDVIYDVRILPTERAAHVRIRVGAHGNTIRQLTFHIDPDRHLQVQGAGALEVKDEYVTWSPPPKGGKLEYVFRIDHLRDERRYDAKSAENWALFRADDLVPPVRARFADGAKSISRLRLRLPKGWKAALPYAREADGMYRIDDAKRAFDRPKGWMLVGRINVLRTRIQGMQVTVAAPHKSAFRRNDLIALLRWNLPGARELLGRLPDRLLIVGADDPMWRGGLSGPDSFFIHSARPLIDEDYTSPPLHELVHALMHARAGHDGDWVVESLAEYYSLELLRRSRSISKSAYRRSARKLAKKAENALSLRVAHADGAVTAKGVLVLQSLDEEIRSRTADRFGLDDVFRMCVEDDSPMTTDGFRSLAEKTTGLDLRAFFETHAPKPGPSFANEDVAAKK